MVLRPWQPIIPYEKIHPPYRLRFRDRSLDRRADTVVAEQMRRVKIQTKKRAIIVSPQERKNFIKDLIEAVGICS